MANVAYLGLDISQADVSVCFLLADGREPVPRWTVANTQPGADRLSATLAQLCQTHQVGELRIGLEATGLLWWHLACALSYCAALLPFQPHIYVLNPHLVQTFRRNYGALPKTDRADAFLIAERIRFGRQLPPPFQLDVRYAPLQRLTRFRFHLAHNLAREKSYFLSFLFLTFSSFGQVQPFGDPFGATSSAVLIELTTEELAQQSLAELAAYLQTQGHGRFAASRGAGRDPATGGARCLPPRQGARRTAAHRPQHHHGQHPLADCPTQDPGPDDRRRTPGHPANPGFGPGPGSRLDRRPDRRTRRCQPFRRR